MPWPLIYSLCPISWKVYHGVGIGRLWQWGNVKLESQPALCQRPAGLGPLQNCYLRRLCMSPSKNRSLNCRGTLSHQVVCQYLLALKALLDYIRPMITIPSNPIPSIHPTYSSQWTKQALDWSEPTYNDLNPMTSDDHHHILTTFWLHFDYILATFWLNSDYILATFWLHFDFTLTTFWLHSDYILTTFWLHPDYILTAFWLHSDYILTTFWLHSDYILTSF